jgi:hypothetical protein
LLTQTLSIKQMGAIWRPVEFAGLTRERLLTAKANAHGVIADGDMGNRVGT